MDDQQKQSGKEVYDDDGILPSKSIYTKDNKGESVDANGFAQKDPSEIKDNKSNPLSPEALRDAEQGITSEDRERFGALAGEAMWLTNLKDAKGIAGTTRVMSKSLLNKRTATGLGVGGGVAGIVITLFFALLPYKLNMMMDNLQSKYFSGTNNAVDKAVDKMFTKYLKEKIIPGLGKPGCGSTKTINKDCVSVSDNDTPFGRLSNAWREGRLENRMSEKYGLELERSPGATTFTVKIDGKTSNVDVDGFLKDPNSNLWTATGSRSDVRNTVRTALEKETGWKKMLYRYRVGKLMESKYGIKRCFVFCKSRDRFADYKDKRKNAFKLMLTQKVLVGRSGMLGEALVCIIDDSCLNGEPDRKDNKPDDLERKDVLQKNVKNYLEKRGTNLTAEGIDKISETVVKLEDAGGLGKYVVIELAEKLGGEAGKKLAKGSIPVIGWIDTAATFINKAATIGPKLRKINYVIGTASAAALAAGMLTASDEQKGGYTDPEVARSMAEALGDTAGDADHKGEPAETSPMYQKLFGSSQQTTAFSIFTPSVSASATVTGYTCPDKTPVGNKDACDDETFRIDNVVTSISDMFNLPGLSALKAAAGVWSTLSSLVDKPLDWVSSLLLDNPLVNAITENVMEYVSPYIEALSGKIFKSFVSDTMSGGRTFQGLAAGMDVLASTSGEFGIGGGQISDAQSSALLQEEELKAQEDFASKPLYARLFDQQDSRSLVGQVAMAMPFTTSTAVSQTANRLVSSPFAVISSGFGNFFTRKASAAGSELPNPFGTLRFGHPEGDTALNVDPTTLTNEYCSAFNEKWADDVEVDEATGMEVHKTGNPCLLYSAATSAAGGKFSDEALNDSASSITSGTDSTPAPTTPGNPNPGPPTGNTYDTSTCQAGTDVSPPGGADGYKNNQLYKIRICRVQGITVNAQISGDLDRLINAARAGGVNLGGGGFRTMQGQIDARKRNNCPDIYTSPAKSCSPPTARPGYSNHQMGLAIDFSNCSTRSTACYKWLASNAKTYKLINLPSEPWHWSVDGN